MTITKDVINDLLPLYEAGEASEDSRRLVEAFLEKHPEMSAGPAADATLKAAVVPTLERNRREALERTRRQISRRQMFFGAALASTLMPFSILVRNGEVSWWMWRDAPDAAGVFIGVAVGCWIGYFRSRSHLRTAGM